MRVLRWIIIAGSVVLVLAVVAIAIGAAWLNTYIHSDAFKQEVEIRAGQSLGGTVQIEKIDFDIFNGVKIGGVASNLDSDHTNNQGALQVKIENVSCAYTWTELFSGRLKLTGVTLDHPQIVLKREADTAAPAPTSTLPATTPESAPATAPESTPTPAPAPTTTTVPATYQGSAMPFQFVLDNVKLNDGTVSVLDETGAPMITLKGVNADANTSGYADGKDVTGTLKIAEMALPSNLQVTDFSTPITYGQDSVQAKPFEATAYGGKITGDYGMSPAAGDNLNLTGKGLDIAQLTAATISNSTAKLSGALDLQSKWSGLTSGGLGDLSGEGDAQLTGGTLGGIKFLHDISQILKITELDQPAITKAQTHFVVQGKQTTFTGMQLESPAFQITGSGTVGFDGRLNAALTLILTKDSMAKLPSQLAASFKAEQDGTGSIAFNVTGTTSDPKTDLPQRLLMQNTQIKSAIDNALKKFFH